MILGLCKQIELQKILDKLPKEKSDEPEGGMGSDTEIGVMEPSESLFSNNSHQEN